MPSTKDNYKQLIKKSVHYQWTARQEEVDKKIDVIIDVICSECASKIIQKLGLLEQLTKLEKEQSE